MELGNPEITAAVVTIAGTLYALFPDLSKKAKTLIPIAIGAALGLALLPEGESIEALTIALFTGIMSGIYGTGGVATAGGIAKKMKPSFVLYEEGIKDIEIRPEDLETNLA